VTVADAGVTHPSDEVAATDSKTFQHSNNNSNHQDCLSSAVEVVKCELKMEVDDDAKSLCWSSPSEISQRGITTADIVLERDASSRLIRPTDDGAHSTGPSFVTQTTDVR